MRRSKAKTQVTIDEEEEEKYFFASTFRWKELDPFGTVSSVVCVNIWPKQ